MNSMKEPTGTASIVTVNSFQSHKRGLFWYDWYSLCSRHHPHNEGCRLCHSGAWVCRWKRRVGHIFFKLWPWAWRKWANRGRKS
jgi:hypothetical protein